MTNEIDMPLNLLVERRVKDWNDWKRETETNKLELKNFDFSGKRAYGADLSNMKIIDCKFQKSDLSATIFSRSSIVNSNFSGAILPRTEWLETEVINCVFNEAQLTAADMSKAKLVDCNVLNAYLCGCLFEESIMAGVDFTKSNLTRAKLIKADFSNANLSGCCLTKAVLTVVNLTGANLYNCSAMKTYKMSKIKLRDDLIIDFPWDKEDQINFPFEN